MSLSYTGVLEQRDRDFVNVGGCCYFTASCKTPGACAFAPIFSPFCLQSFAFSDAYSPSPLWLTSSPLFTSISLFLLFLLYNQTSHWSHLIPVISALWKCLKKRGDEWASNSRATHYHYTRVWQGIRGRWVVEKERDWTWWWAPGPHSVQWWPVLIQLRGSEWGAGEMSRVLHKQTLLTLQNSLQAVSKKKVSDVSGVNVDVCEQRKKEAVVLCNTE